MKFKIEITETLQRLVEVEADNVTEAIIKVMRDYKDGNIVLGSEDFAEYEISEFKEECTTKQ